MRCRALALLTCAVACVAPETAVPPVVPDFADASQWLARPSDGVSLDISTDTVEGVPVLRLDFDFHGGGGYAVARRPVRMAFPANYEFRFRIRGDSPPNDLEFKLEDPSGENVWWVNRRDFEFPDTFTEVRLKKRHISFAWGPAGGGDIAQAAALEFAITAGSGGRGTVWIDGLTLVPLDPPAPYAGTPELSASGSLRGRPPDAALDGDTATAWAARAANAPRLDIDFGSTRELGGLVLDWAPDSGAVDYDVLLSVDGEAWTMARAVRGGDGGRDWIHAPDSDARHVRIAVQAAEGEALALRELAVQPLGWSATINDFFSAIARDAPRGHYPRDLLGEAVYWTVTGVDADREEALVDSDGRVEAGSFGFSIEPFLRTDSLLTWADGGTVQELVDDVLPLPRITRTADSLALTVTALAAGDTGASAAWVRYRVHNLTAGARTATLYLAVRPFQVNPAYQFLNSPGGAVAVRSLRYAAGVVSVNGGGRVVSLDAPAGFGAVTFDGGGIVPALARGRLPAAAAVEDPFGYASGALAYTLELPSGGARDVHVIVPLYDGATVPAAAGPATAAAQAFDARLAEARRTWTRVSPMTLDVAGQGGEAAATLRTNVAWVLINRDGAAIQPGSRAYARSWIRDGSLTSAALLRVGRADVVREFIDWFAPFQFENGKVPCCVDRSGAGPVPENDSHGQLIFLIAEYFRHTGDGALVRRHWPHVQAAVAYMDSLRATRMTDEYRADNRRAYFGLLPESISHEGYSARPVHSYWDDLFALRGLRDAAFLADTLGFDDEAVRWAALRDDFERTFAASVQATMDLHGIDFVPGSVELGDFDATSTTVALSPTDARALLPDSALVRTFERYWTEFVARRDGPRDWEAYTPYELRNVGAFVRLGWKRRALEALDFFLADRRPAAWHQWAEVVPGDTASTRFIGDMPHTWVGSDFIRSFLDFFAWEDEGTGELVIGAGVPEAWLGESGVRVGGLSTWWGPLDLTIERVGDGVQLVIGGDLRTPPGGLRVHTPLETAVIAATVDGQPVQVRNGVVHVESVPARVIFRHAAR